MAHRPPKVKKLPQTPVSTRAAGQVSRFLSTAMREARTAVRSKRGRPAPPAGAGSRTRSQHAAPRTRESPPTPTKTLRQPVAWARAERGAPASTDPRLPTRSAAPTTVAKRFSSKVRAMIFSRAMKVTDTPRPTRVRPARATSSVGARAKTPLPTPPTMPPSSRMRRGPRVSTRMPVGICISV